MLHRGVVLILDLNGRENKRPIGNVSEHKVGSDPSNYTKCTIKCTTNKVNNDKIRKNSNLV